LSDSLVQPSNEQVVSISDDPSVFICFTCEETSPSKMLPKASYVTSFEEFSYTFSECDFSWENPEDKLICNESYESSYYMMCLLSDLGESTKTSFSIYTYGLILEDNGIG